MNRRIENIRVRRNELLFCADLKSICADLNQEATLPAIPLGVRAGDGTKEDPHRKLTVTLL